MSTEELGGILESVSGSRSISLVGKKNLVYAIGKTQYLSVGIQTSLLEVDLPESR